MMTTLPTTFGEAALALNARGWGPIPLRIDAKIPAEPGWTRFNDERWPKEELALACLQYPTSAVGLAIRPETLALDLDVTDKAAAEAVEALADQHLGKTPLVRIGQAPKSLRLYRAGDGVRTTKRHPIEVFSGSGQIAAFGIHAKTGKPYTWPDSNPLRMGPLNKKLPMVGRPELYRFLGAVEPILRGLRGSRGPSGATIGLEPGERLRDLLRRGLSLRRASEAVLHGATDGGRHAAVCAVVSRALNVGMSATDTETLIYKIAPPSVLRLVEADGYLARLLFDFRPRQVGGWSARR